MSRVLKVVYVYLLALTAITPVLLAYSSMQDWLNFSSTVMPIAYLLGIMGVIYGIIFLCTKKHIVRSMNLSIILFLYLFLYGYIFTLALSLSESFVRAQTMVHVGLVLVLIIILLVAFREKKSVFFAGGVVHLIAMPYLLPQVNADNSQLVSPVAVGIEASANSPDIFYIVPDCYTSNSILSEYYNYDNSAFTDELKEQGFFIAGGARSNYLHTRFSLASTLNLDYLDKVAADRKLSVVNDAAMLPLISDNVVASSLRSAGYDIKHTSAVFTIADSLGEEIVTPDAFKVLDIAEIVKLYSIFSALNENLAAQAFYNAHDKSLSGLTNYLKQNNDAQRRPYFVLTHWLLPHIPFLVDNEGEFQESYSPYDIMGIGHLGKKQLLDLWRGKYPDKEDEFFYQYHDTGYVDNVRFFNERFLAFATYLKMHHVRPYAIIMQGDHGCVNMESLPHTVADAWNSKSYLEQRSQIMSAIYFSDQDYETLSSDMTSVNVFRAVLSKYFDVDIKRLENKTFFSKHKSGAALFEEISFE